jgi:integrase
MRTGDRREATRRVALWESQVRTYLMVVRRKHPTMTREQLDALTRQYLERSLEEIERRLALQWDEPGLDARRFDLAEEAELLSAGILSSRFEKCVQEARELVPGADEELARRLARRLVEARLDAAKAELRAISGEPLRLPMLERLERTGLAPAPLQESKPPTPRLSEVVRVYSEAKKATKDWSERSAEHYAEIYATLVDLMGDPEVGAVTKDDIRRLGLALTRYPKNAKKVLPGLSPSDAVQRAGDDEAIAKLSPRSVNTYQQAARSLFKWAHAHDLIGMNPATVLADVKVRGTARDERLPFTDADLSAYFAQLEGDRTTNPWLYWVAAIMAYTGCRLGEAAQLRKDDLRQEAGVWVVDINANHPGKHLKTDYSQRLIPMHPRLLDLGVLELEPATPDGFLWPAPMRTPRRPADSPIDRLQRLLATRLQRAGVRHPKKTAAHSFRHTVSARLKGASVPDYQIAEILGHKNESMSTGRYGSTTDVVRLHEVIKLLQLPV